MDGKGGEGRVKFTCLVTLPGKTKTGVACGSCCS